MHASQDEDLQFITRARQGDVLLDIDPAQYPPEARIGNQCVYCADSDQAGDIIAHHGRMMSGISDRSGWVGLYGGALAIPDHSPVNHGEGRTILEHLYLGHLLGKGGTIILHSHHLCAMAQLHRLSVVDCFRLVGDSKLTTREFIKGRRAAAQRYDDFREILRRKHGVEPEPARVAMEAELHRKEAFAIARAEALLMLKGLTLKFALEKPDPIVVAHFQVDYGNRKRTYMFDRHAFLNLLQRDQSEITRLAS